MTQQDIYAFLKENKGKIFTPRQVAEQMGISFNSAINALRKLRKSNLIKYTEGRKRDTFEYWLE